MPTRSRSRVSSALRFAFATGGIVLVSLVIFLTTELFAMKSQLDHRLNQLRQRYDDQYVGQGRRWDTEIAGMKTTLNDELVDVRQRLASQRTTLDRHHVMIQQLTQTVDERLNTTIHDLNATVAWATTTVRGQVFDLTRDVGGFVNTTQDQFDSQNSFMAFQSAGTFTVMGGIVTLWHLTTHLRQYHEPIVQRKIMAILWMCPIYAVTSWLSLYDTNLEGYLAVLKDFYEAYCIYTFLSFLIAVLGRGDREVVVDLLAKQGSEHLQPPWHFWPSSLSSSSSSSSCHHCTSFAARWCPGRLTPRRYENARHKADTLLMQCQISAMQFALVRPITSLLFLLFNAVYGRVSIWNPAYPQFYLTMIVNLSVAVAFSGLLKFYHAVQDELAWCRPFPKFLCIKGVVFMTFWQSLALSIYANTTVRSNHPNEDPVEWRYRTQNYLICIEMFFFSVVHYFVFAPEEWEEGYKPKEMAKQKFGDKMALRDFVQDIKLIVRSRKRTKKKKKDMEVGLTTTTTTVSDDHLREREEEDEKDHHRHRHHHSNGDGGGSTAVATAAALGSNYDSSTNSRVSPLEIACTADPGDHHDATNDDYVETFLGLEDEDDDDDDMEFISSVLQEAESLKLEEEEEIVSSDGGNYKEIL